MTRAIAAITLALCLLATACLGEPPPTREPNRVPAQTNEALQRQIAELQTQTAAALLTPPAQAVPTEAPAPTANAGRKSRGTPTAAPQPTERPLRISSIANICRRPPQLQQAILESLRISLCSAATNEELFRITHLQDLDIQADNLTQGDFHGLTNVSALRVDAGAIGPRAFEGMNRLTQLEVTVRDGHLSSHAFAGLPKLRALSLTIHRPPEPQTPAAKTAEEEHYGHLTAYPAAPWTDLVQLRTLTVRTPARSLALSHQARPLRNLGSLESLHVENNDPRREEATPALRISADLLPESSHLTSLSLKNNTDSATSSFPSDLLAAHPHITSLNLDGYWRIPRNALAHLSQLQQLQVSRPLRQSGERHRLSLHHDSPIYKTARYAGDMPSNVEVVNLPEER